MSDVIEKISDNYYVFNSFREAQTSKMLVDALGNDCDIEDEMTAANIEFRKLDDEEVEELEGAKTRRMGIISY